jgi:hypothetical protein
MYHHWDVAIDRKQGSRIGNDHVEDMLRCTRKLAYPYSPQTMLVENDYRMSDNWGRTELSNTPDTVRYAFLL